MEALRAPDASAGAGGRPAPPAPGGPLDPRQQHTGNPPLAHQGAGGSFAASRQEGGGGQQPMQPPPALNIRALDAPGALQRSSSYPEVSPRAMARAIWDTFTPMDALRSPRGLVVEGMSGTGVAAAGGAGADEILSFLQQPRGPGAGDGSGSGVPGGPSGNLTPGPRVAGGAVPTNIFRGASIDLAGAAGADGGAVGADAPTEGPTSLSSSAPSSVSSRGQQQGQQYGQGQVLPQKTLPELFLSGDLGAAQSTLLQLASPDAFMKFGFSLDGAFAQQPHPQPQQLGVKAPPHPQASPSLASFQDSSISSTGSIASAGSEGEGTLKQAAMGLAPLLIPPTGSEGGAAGAGAGGALASWQQFLREAAMSPHTMQVNRMLESLNVDEEQEEQATAATSSLNRRQPTHVRASSDSQSLSADPRFLKTHPYGGSAGAGGGHHAHQHHAPSKVHDRGSSPPSAYGGQLPPTHKPHQHQHQHHAPPAPQLRPNSSGSSVSSGPPSTSGSPNGQAPAGSGPVGRISPEVLASFELLRQQLGHEEAVRLLLLHYQQQQLAEQQAAHQKALLQQQQQQHQQRQQQRPTHHQPHRQPPPAPQKPPPPPSLGWSASTPSTSSGGGGGGGAMTEAQRAFLELQQRRQYHQQHALEDRGYRRGDADVSAAAAGINPALLRHLVPLKAERSLSEGAIPFLQSAKGALGVGGEGGGRHGHGGGRIDDNFDGAWHGYHGDADGGHRGASPPLSGRLPLEVLLQQQQLQAAGLLGMNPAGLGPRGGPGGMMMQGGGGHGGMLPGMGGAGMMMPGGMLGMGMGMGMGGSALPPGLLVNKVDALAAKRAELVESPTTRLQFKDFYRQFRAKERCSFEAAKEYALACFDLLPRKVHWKLYLEMADLAKRENRIDEARRLYRKVCRLQPHASQGWLEYSKMEEECGDMETAAKILRKGLVFCEYSENLLARAIKHEERKRNVPAARELLSRLRHVGIDKVWRTVLEGALLEARAGNDDVARRVLKYLMSHVPWYGPIYNEAFRLEEKAERNATALAIVERGLKEIPRYGPLWFGAFRLCERLDLEAGAEALAQGQVPDLPRTRDAITRALGSISKELIWKVHFEAAQIEERVASLAAAVRVARRREADPAAPQDDSAVARERNGLLERCRRCYVEAVLSSPSNLRWKVWLAGARTELGTGNVAVARGLLQRAFQEVPDKSKAHVFLECARLEEFVGGVERARKILLRSRLEARGEWKVFLESVLLEMRAGQWGRAVEEAKAALQIHTGTGRLWAILVQLRYLDGDGEQLRVLRQALGEVPKSGEVWCEGARIHLSPLSRAFDLDKAEKYLDFAIQFTPQYGDSFLELLRLLLVREVVMPQAQALYARLVDEEPQLQQQFQQQEQEEEEEGEGAAVRHIARAADALATPGSPGRPSVESFMACDTDELELRCSNADPNYGQLWFHVRDMPSDTPRLLMRRAKALMAQDLTVLYPLYLTAIVRRMDVERRVRAELGAEAAGEGEGKGQARVGEEQQPAASEPEEPASFPSREAAPVASIGAEEVEDKKEDKGKDAEAGAAAASEAGTTNAGAPSSAAAAAAAATAAPASSSSPKAPGVSSGSGAGEKDDKVELKEARAKQQQAASSRSEAEVGSASRREEQRAARRVERGVDAALAQEPPPEAAVVDGEGKLLRLQQWDFVTGLVGLNRIASRIAELRDEEKRKMLFGSDQLVP